MPPLPQGYKVAGIFCGIKKKADKLDMTLVVSDRPAAAAGVYTTNLVFAAPVALDRARTPGEGFRVVAINSGNANACTGDRGMRDAEEMARLAAATCGARGEQALVMSTGVIGNFLPMEKVAAGIQAASAQLGTTDAHLDSAGRGILTTDTGPKIAGRTLTLGGRIFERKTGHDYGFRVAAQRGRKTRFLFGRRLLVAESRKSEWSLHSA